MRIPSIFGKNKTASFRTIKPTFKSNTSRNLQNVSTSHFNQSCSQIKSFHLKPPKGRLKTIAILNNMLLFLLASKKFYILRLILYYMKKVLALSVGGSMIIPDKINYEFVESLKKTLEKHYKTHKFVIVCGGGSIARKYIDALRKEGKTKKERALAGIMATRMNAKFLIQFFGKDAHEELPKN